jgi:hypothetical protein
MGLMMEETEEATLAGIMMVFVGGGAMRESALGL